MDTEKINEETAPLLGRPKLELRLAGLLPEVDGQHGPGLDCGVLGSIASSVLSLPVLFAH